MLDPALPNHRKVKRLARSLRVGVPTALGYLVHGWCDTMHQAEAGVLQGYTQGEVTLAFGYRGDPKRFVKAMIDAGWLEKTQKGYVVHDWPEHQGDIVEQRAKWRERKQKQRDKEKDVTRDSRDGHVLPPLPSPSIPIPSLPGREPRDEVIRQVLQQMEESKIIGRLDTKRSYVEGWMETHGGEYIMEVLYKPDIRGHQILEVHDAYFGKNGKTRDVKKRVSDWITKKDK